MYLSDGEGSERYLEEAVGSSDGTLSPESSLPNETIESDCDLLDSRTHKACKI